MFALCHHKNDIDIETSLKLRHRMVNTSHRPQQSTTVGLFIVNANRAANKVYVNVSKLCLQIHCN